MKSLGDKTLITLVGPSAIGKSTVMNRVVVLDQRFSRVKSFTTRPPRPNDEPNQYFYLQPNDIDRLETAGDIITRVTYPNTGQTYGTLKSSYQGDYNLLDTLASSVEIYRQLPFRSTAAISLTSSAELWQRWFLNRYPAPSEEAGQRLDEAELSIAWSLSQPQNHRWLVNDLEVSQAATKLVNMVVSDLPGDEGAPKAYAMLELIRGGVWREK